MKHVFTIGAVSIACLVGVSFNSVTPLVIWNKTESVPTGLYLRAFKAPEKGDLVAYQPTPDVRKWLTERDYLPVRVPLLKVISATQGDVVCRDEASISINHEHRAVVLSHDTKGREMPVWSGCFVLKEGDIFLLNDHPASLDGRYFGVSARDKIIGTYRLVWEADR